MTNCTKSEETVKVLPITYYGDPKLEQPSVAVGEVSHEIWTLANDMLATMYENNGIGLAGPQVGRNIRVVVVDIPMDEGGLPFDASAGERMLLPRMPLVLINPEVSPLTSETETVEEGCLSFPNIYGDVERPVTVMLKTRLLNGEMVQTACGGLLGRCLQHELDHLDGVVFVNRMKEADRAEIEGSLKKLKKQTRKRLKA